MTITASDITYIAELAKLDMKNRDAEQYVEDLSRILELVDYLQEIETHDTEPLAHPLDVSQQLRPDKVTETDQREQLQSIAPLIEQHYYLVPKVIE